MQVQFRGSVADLRRTEEAARDASSVDKFYEWMGYGEYEVARKLIM